MPALVVAQPLVHDYPSFCIREFIHKKSPMNAMSMKILPPEPLPYCPSGNSQCGESLPV